VRLRKHGMAIAVAGTAVAALLAGCAGGGLQQSSGSSAQAGSLAAKVDLKGQTYTVGSKDFDEQLVLCEMTIAVLQSAGATVNPKCNVGGTEATRNALLGGQIDMYWEYTGTAQVTFFGGKPIQDAQQQYQTVKNADLTKNQIAWLAPSAFNNTYAFGISEAKAQELGITSDSDMAAYYTKGGTGTTCVESEYLNRDDGLPGFLKTYGFTLPAGQPTVLQTGAVYQATSDPTKCLFGEVFTTDGRIPALKLRVLTDDKTYHPLYNAALTVRKSVYDKNPAIADLFAPISAALTNDEMLKLNGQKSSENIPERKVARDWLVSKGFIGASNN
jgi:osmoprotectant transport system substrate-binding protein